ncbi:response regulator [Thiocystis violacea]|uniref:response regulator n=1 Tax=Thiocystis violacea TaxID=13725 RepID=UPI0019082C28|nr:response regulator [Thiocystis violacea]
MSILVVDDNTMLLSKIVRSLVLAKQVVRTATSLAEARALLREHPPKVLCLDLQLPDGNGLDLLAELRRAGSELPVIIISGHHSEENRARAERLGAAGFLAKPFALSELHRRLAALLGDPPMSAGDAATPRPQTCRPAAIVEPVAAARLRQAKRAYSTRRVDLDRATGLLTAQYAPQAGDLVLARVDRLMQHKRLELITGRRADLFPGDEIIVCYGNRYAPDQFEAEVPADLSPCHLVAAGGIAAQCLSRNTKIAAASRITPIGVLASADGRPLNLADHGLAPRVAPERRPTVTAVIGTSMNAGKTTTLANLALGMTRRGLKVGAAKVTGTGAGGDVWHMTDAGCHVVLDFVDGGAPSTYKLPITDCETILETLVATLCAAEVDTILIEVADGILQEETRQLVQSATFARLVDNVIFAAGDALGAAGGVDWLRSRGLNLIGVSGALTAAPLAIRECAGLVDLPLLPLDILNGGSWCPQGVGLAVATDARAA